MNPATQPVWSVGLKTECALHAQLAVSPTKRAAFSAAVTAFPWEMERVLLARGAGSAIEGTDRVSVAMQVSDLIVGAVEPAR